MEHLAGPAYRADRTCHMMAERNDSFTAGAPRRRAVLPPIAAGVRRGRSAVCQPG
jgi:hypothetical protein